MSTTGFICVTCGAQFPPSTAAPDRCPVCEDERQYIARDGQQWITLPDLQRAHRNQILDVAPGVVGIATEPRFAIGQQAHLISTPAGNILWNCIALLDDATITAIRQRGGVAAIAISHPHFFTSMVEWGNAFDVPILIHADDRDWVLRPDPRIQFWDQESHQPLPGSGLTLIHCGGHFPGSCVLHNAAGDGALFTGDTISVTADRRWVTFMYSYPNSIPLDAAAVWQIVAAIDDYPYEQLYGGWDGDVVARAAKAAVHRSARRYVAHLRGLSPANE